MNKLTLLLAVTLVLAGNSFAVHDLCSDCHTIHNSQDGIPIDPENPFGNNALLIMGNVTDLCLSCHNMKIGAVLGTNPAQPPPEKGAGNFVYLLKIDLNNSGGASPVPGRAAGHNIVAPAYGLVSDDTYPVSPGGTFPSNKLGCSSCHSPHANQNFRQLNGAGPIMAKTYTFTAPAPVAEGIDLLVGSESNGNHTAYKSGVSEWCGNCHGNYHEGTGRSKFGHPSSANLVSSAVLQYDRYNGMGDSAGASHETAYLAVLPFEDPNATVSSMAGPTTSSKVMCLTCHRAHASPVPHAGRWDFAAELQSKNDPNAGTAVSLGLRDNPTSPRLCNKCHPKGKD